MSFPIVKYILSPIIIYLFYILTFLSGRYFEYVEFPNQWRTEIQENNNYEPHFVSVRLPALFPLPSSRHTFFFFKKKKDDANSTPLWIAPFL